MQAHSRSQISAPKCTAITVTLDSSATAGNSIIVSTGSSKLSVATAVNSNSFSVSDRGGFFAGQTVVIGYGTRNEETLTVDAGYTEATGNGVLNSSTVAKKAHFIGERIVRTSGLVAIRPGSVVITTNGTSVNSITDAGGTGVLIGTNAMLNATGTVDYSTGAVSLNSGTGGTIGAAAVLAYTADQLNDAADIADLSGAGFHKSNVSGILHSNIPTSVNLENLGDNPISYFLEVSNNGGRSFTTVGYLGSGRSGVLSGLSRATAMVVSEGVDAMRVRAGIASNDNSANQTEGEARLNWRGILEVNKTFITDKAH